MNHDTLTPSPGNGTERGAFAEGFEPVEVAGTTPVPEQFTGTQGKVKVPAVVDGVGTWAGFRRHLTDGCFMGSIFEC